MLIAQASEAITPIAKTLSTYGGWGVAAILFVAIAVLYMRTEKKYAEQQEKFIGLLRECSTVLTTVRDNQTDQKNQNQQIIDLNKEVERVLKNVDDKMN